MKSSRASVSEMRAEPPPLRSAEPNLFPRSAPKVNALAFARHNAGRHETPGFSKHSIRQSVRALVPRIHRGAQRLWPDASDGPSNPGQPSAVGSLDQTDF